MSDPSTATRDATLGPTQVPPQGSATQSRWSRWRSMARTDLQRLVATGVPHMFAALLGTQGMGIIRRVMLARIFTEIELGQMTLVTRIVESVTILADLGICTAILKYAAEPVPLEEKRRIYSMGLAASAGLAVLTGLVYCGAILLLMPRSEAVWPFMLLAALYIPGTALTSAPLCYLQAIKLAKQAATYTAITQFVGVLAVLWASWQFRLWGFFIVVSAVPLFNLALLLTLTRAHWHWWLPTAAMLRKLVGFGYLSMLANLAGTGNFAVLVALLRHLTHSDAQVGVFSVGMTVMLGFKLLPDALMRVAFPYLSGLLRDPGQFRRRQRELAVKQLGVLLGATVAWALAAPWLIPLVFGARYTAAVWPSVILVAGLLPHGFAGPAGQTLLIQGRVAINLVAGLLRIGMTSGLCILLVPRLGLVGAALALTLSQLGVSWFSVKMADRTLRQAELSAHP